MAVGPRAQRRCYCFTSYNLDFNYVSGLENQLPTPMTYLVYQLELCPTTNRVHHQGYAEFSRPVRFRPTKLQLGGIQTHLEARHGTQQEAIDYCKKEQTRVAGTRPFEYGVPHEGRGGQQRREWSSLKLAIERGTCEEDLADAFFVHCVRYPSGVARMRYLASLREHNRNNWRNVTVYVYWGATGTGKSRRALFEAPQAYFVSFDGKNRVWWDGYDGQETIILDDFDGSQVSFRHLLRLLDGHPKRLAVKGSHTHAHYTKVIITSNLAPVHWYVTEDFDPLDRRFTAVTQLTDVWLPPQETQGA